jgi:type I restriction enzyme S subunit
VKAGWGISKLGEVSAINYGYTESASSEPVGPRFLRITDIQDDNVDWDTVPYCKLESKELSKYELVSGDIVFARTGATTGKSFLVMDPPKAVFASYLIRLRLLDKKLLPEFVSLFFQTGEYWQAIKDGSSGSAQGGFNATKLGALSIPVPPLPEQRRIVGILDEAFEGIASAKANAEKNLQNARALFESQLQSVFTRYGDGWLSRHLKDVCEKITDGTHQTPTYFDSGVLFLSSRNVTSGRIDWDNIKYIDTKQHLEMHRRVAPRLNDILLAKNGTTGVAALVDRDLTFDIYVSLALLRAKDEVLPQFLLHFVNSPVAKQQFNKRLKGIGVPNLHLEEIREVEIAFPKSLAEQKTIVTKLDSLREETDRLASIYQQKLAALDELKKSLLHQAFSGEL